VAFRIGVRTRPDHGGAPVMSNEALVSAVSEPLVACSV
jgi:hypothetical protein